MQHRRRGRGVRCGGRPAASIAAAVIAAVAITGCGVREVVPARYVEGETRRIASATIGPEGGTFEAPSYDVGLTQLSVEVSPGAVEETTTFGLGVDSGRVIDLAGTPAGVLIVLDAEELREFQEPVRVTVGFTGHGDAKAAVGYSLETTGALTTLDLAGFDAAEGTATFSTYRPVTFTWVYLE